MLFPLRSLCAMPARCSRDVIAMHRTDVAWVLCECRAKITAIFWPSLFVQTLRQLFTVILRTNCAATFCHHSSYELCDNFLPSFFVRTVRQLFIGTLRTNFAATFCCHSSYKLYGNFLSSLFVRTLR
jgi:hypothetical protein